eukprot:TCONS_00021013-protein
MPFDFKPCHAQTFQSLVNFVISYSDPDLKAFVTYFNSFKKDVVRYHSTTAAVRNAALCDEKNHFYNNRTESKNRLLKEWQSFNKVDFSEFAKVYESIIDAEESEILEAFLGLKSRFDVREEFKHHMMPFSKYSQLTQPEKDRYKERILNIIVDPEVYQSVMQFKVGEHVVSRARKQADEIEAAHDIIEIIDEGDAPMPGDIVHQDDNTWLRLHEAMPNESHENILGSMSKAVMLNENQSIMKGYASGTYFVKSTQHPHVPHVIKTAPNGKFICDNSCQRFTTRGYCGHCLAVALKENQMEKYVSFLKRMKSGTTLTKAASSNINKKVTGKKVPTRKRQRENHPSPVKISLTAAIRTPTLQPFQPNFPSYQQIAPSHQPHFPTCQQTVPSYQPSFPPLPTVQNAAIPEIQQPHPSVSYIPTQNQYSSVVLQTLTHTQPAINNTNQFGRPIIPPGGSLGRKPRVPVSKNPFVVYRTTTRRGRKCNFCGGDLDETFSIHHTENYWFPNVND